eukprot:gene26234-32778_t
MALLSPLLGAPLYFDKIKQSRQQTQLNELNIKKIKLEIKEKEDAATDLEEKKNQVGKSLALPLEKAPTADDIAQALLARKKIARRRSNYYEASLTDSKIDAVGFAPSHNKVTADKVVPRSDFGNFVIAKANLEPLVYEGLLLEIVSPVLRSGSIKWRGYAVTKVLEHLRAKVREFGFGALDAEIAGGDPEIRRNSNPINSIIVKNMADYCSIETLREELVQ